MQLANLQFKKSLEENKERQWRNSKEKERLKEKWSGNEEKQDLIRGLKTDHI